MQVLVIEVSPHRFPVTLQRAPPLTSCAFQVFSSILGLFGLIVALLMSYVTALVILHRADPDPTCSRSGKAADFA